MELNPPQVITLEIKKRRKDKNTNQTGKAQEQVQTRGNWKRTWPGTDLTWNVILGHSIVWPLPMGTECGGCEFGSEQTAGWEETDEGLCGDGMSNTEAEFVGLT